MPQIGDIKTDKDGKKLIYAPCKDCGKPRWTRYRNGRSRNVRCITCSRHGILVRTILRRMVRYMEQGIPDIDLSRLEPIERAQLLQFYPQLKVTSWMPCQRCYNGQVPTKPDWNGEYYCKDCGAEHDRYGSLIKRTIGWHGESRLGGRK